VNELDTNGSEQQYSRPNDLSEMVMWDDVREAIEVYPDGKNLQLEKRLSAAAIDSEARNKA
jgi:hypothetical protein